jgi:hypothetical protein
VNYNDSVTRIIGGRYNRRSIAVYARIFIFSDGANNCVEVAQPFATHQLQRS